MILYKTGEWNFIIEKVCVKYFNKKDVWLFNESRPKRISQHTQYHETKKAAVLCLKRRLLLDV